MEDYPVEKDNKVYPLNLLKNNKDITHVVLSIGGNDVRVEIFSCYGNTEELIKKLKTNDVFIGNYKKAVEEVLKIKPNVILVIVYRPGPGFLLPLKSINLLFEEFAPKMIDFAREKSIPVIDLSRTFDPLDSSHYGTTPIEPSNESGMFIAELVNTVLNDYDFEYGSSKVYYGHGNNIKIEDNKEGYKYSV